MQLKLVVSQLLGRSFGPTSSESHIQHTLYHSVKNSAAAMQKKVMQLKLLYLVSQLSAGPLDIPVNTLYLQEIHAKSKSH